ncbi:cytochrome P450 [Amycolatopsis sp. NPDC059021]|uniref:cytochrome P450 n=1 Tax=Amycolatopsis sp. NPDC059021 TaxID=3346704 RepID=UPI00366D8CA8
MSAMVVESRREIGPDERAVPKLPWPVPRVDPLGLPTAYSRLLADKPVSRVRLATGNEAWLVTKHRDVRAVLLDDRFSADASLPNYPIRSQAGNLSVLGRTFVRMDPPKHTTYRRMLGGDFSLKRIRELWPRIERIVEESFEHLAAQPRPADFVRDFALPIPSRIICSMLGVPYADHAHFQRLSTELIDHSLPRQRNLDAGGALNDYLTGIVAAKEADPGDDILTKLIGQYRRGVLERSEIADISLLLLVAGHETTANMITLGTMALLRDRGKVEMLLARPDLLENVVEELLRYLTVFQLGMGRVALADAEVGGVTIPAGSGVLVLLQTANRDEDVFADPAELDLYRETKQHVAFGYGVHQCLAQNLARAELQVVFGRLFQRFPGLRLAKPIEEIPFREALTVYGAFEMPVTW